MSRSIYLGFLQCRAHGVKDLGLRDFQRAGHVRAGCGAMTAAAKLLGQLAAVDMTTAAEADFDAAVRLFHQEQSDLHPGNAAREVHQVFAVGGNGPRGRATTRLCRAMRRSTIPAASGWAFRK